MNESRASTSSESGGAYPVRFSRRHALLALASTALTSCESETKPEPCATKCPGPSHTSSPSAFDRALAEYETQPAAAGNENNEAGNLAWGQSYVLLALMRVYAVTRRLEYLDTFTRIAENVLAQTDRNRGVTDYLGRSGPVWRAGGKYTAASARLLSPDGRPLLEIRYAGDAANQSTATVSQGSEPGSFSLTLAHPSTEPIRLADVSTTPGSTRYAPIVVLSEAYHPSTPWTASVVERGVPSNGTTQLLSQYNVFAVSTGMITYPMALFARTVLEDDGLARGAHRTTADQLLRAAQDAVAFHAPDWSETSEGMAGYVAPKGSPVAQDGSYLPLNQSNALGQTLAELYRITGDHGYADKVQKLAHSWRASLTRPPTEGARWPYWPPFSPVFTGYSVTDQVSVYTPEMQPTRRLDDLSHSAITVEFAIAAHGARIGITDRDLGTLVSTYLHQLKSGPASVRTRFGGPVSKRADSVQCARWLGLADRRIARHIRRVVQRADPRATNGSVVLARGYLEWAAGEGLL